MAGAGVLDADVDEAGRREERRHLGAVARLDGRAPRPPEDRHDEPFLEPVQEPLPAGTAAARQDDDASAACEARRDSGDEVCASVPGHEVEDVDDRDRAERRSRQLRELAHPERPPRRAAEPRLSPRHLPRVGVDADVGDRGASRAEEEGEEAGSAPDVEERALPGESGDDARPGRAPPSNGEVKPRAGREGRGRAEDRPWAGEAARRRESHGP